jgi:hypothetical protein
LVGTQGIITNLVKLRVMGITQQGWGGGGKEGGGRGAGEEEVGGGREVFFLGTPSFSWGWLEWCSHGLPTLVIVVFLKFVMFYTISIHL